MAATVKINGKDFKLRFTIGFWKKIQEKCEVTKTNMEAKLQADFGNVAPWIVLYGAYYGMDPMPANVDKMPFSTEDIEKNLDGSVMDAFEEAIIEGMTKAEKELVQMVKDAKAKKVKEVKAENEEKPGSKKSR